MPRRVQLLVLFSLVLVLLVGGFAGQAAESQNASLSKDACTGCHDEYSKSYSDSVHGKKVISGAPAATSECQACHGNGDEHIAKGGGKGTGITSFNRKEDPKIRSSRCLACHEENRSVVFWSSSKHASSDVACNDCHAMHVPAGQKLRQKEPDVCFACHRDVKAQFGKQSRHPVKEGLMKCTDCHSTHGQGGPKMLKEDSVNDQCFKCHAEKRGPFMWEHPPVEENCLNCHEAHGSSHSRLLVRKMPGLCQSCHDSAGHPGIPYTSQHGFSGSATSDKNKMFGRSCVNCHTNIHGSTGPSSRGKQFVR